MKGHIGLLIAVLGLWACGDEPVAPIDAAAFELTEDTLELRTGLAAQVYALPKYVPFGTAFELVWSSSDTAVATAAPIDDYWSEVRGHGAGTAVLRAARTLQGRTATDSLVVRVEPTPDWQVSVVPATATLTNGSALQFRVSGVSGGYFCATNQPSIIVAETNADGCLVRTLVPGAAMVIVTSFERPQMKGVAMITVLPQQQRHGAARRSGGSRAVGETIQ